MRFVVVTIATSLFIGHTQAFAAAGTDWYPSPQVTQSSEIQYQPLRCPTIGQDESTMIAALRTIQDQIKSSANCNALTSELQQLEMLGGDRRTEFMTLIEKARGGAALTDAENKKLVTYVEQVTMKSASLAALLANSKQCFQEQDLSQYLMAVSSFVNEGSTLLSTVTGPWGPAIAIGGKVVAGLIQGVNRFIKSLPGYDFKDKKQWQGYVETLCMFHDQQYKVYALIHPEQALNELNILNKNLQSKLDQVMKPYNEKRDLLTAFNAQNDSQLWSLSNQINNYNANNDGLKAVRLLAAQQWTQKRSLLIQKDAADPSINSTGRNLIQKMRDETEEFLISKQGPKFLAWQLRDAEKEVQELRSLILRSGYPIFSQIAQYNPNFVNSQVDLFASSEEAIVKLLMTMDAKQFTSANSEEAAHIYALLSYFRRAVYKQWDAITLAYDVKYSFCDFFQKAGYYSPDIGSVCTSRGSKALEASLERYAALNIGLSVPSYLRKYENASRGLNWNDSLDTWLKAQ